MEAAAFENKYVLIGIVGAGLYLLIKQQGGLPNLAKNLAENTAQAATEAVLGMAGGVATGVVDGVSTTIGIPTTKETITDARECKMYLDANGYWSASAKCSAPAFFEAITM
jgi:hypothetical protein